MDRKGKEKKPSDLEVQVSLTVGYAISSTFNKKVAHPAYNTGSV